MFKNLLDKGKCSLGFHEGEWHYEQSDSCMQLRVCQRCQNESRRTEHQWGEWIYQADAACDLIRTCPRCGETESRIEHSWADATYKYTDSCEQVHICARCGEEKPAGIEHQWEQWQYLSAGDCTQVQVCGRCGEKSQQKRIGHDWGAWQQSTFYDAPLCVCRHCGEMVFDLGQNGDSSPSLQEVDRLVEDLLAADSIESLYYQVNQQQGTLFSPVQERYFQFAYDQYPQDPEFQESLHNLQVLLQLCQQHGIEATFAELTGNNQTAQAPAVAVPQSAPTAPSPGRLSGAGQVDQRLVGSYRHTESNYSDGFSMATDTHMHLGSDGRFSWSSETAGSFGSSRTGPVYGRWSVEDGQLCLYFDDGSRYREPFELSSDSLFLPQQGHYRLWTRY